MIPSPSLWTSYTIQEHREFQELGERLRVKNNWDNHFKKIIKKTKDALYAR